MSNNKYNYNEVNNYNTAHNNAYSNNRSYSDNQSYGYNDQYYDYDDYNQDDSYTCVDYNVKSKKSKKKTKAKMLVSLIVLSNLAVFIIYYKMDISSLKAQVTSAANMMVDSSQQNKDISDNDVPLDAQEKTQEKEQEESTPTQKPEVLDSLKSYYEENSDLIGWLSIKNTPIDNPVMCTPWDEEFYLDKDFYKKPFKAGTLFIDTSSNLKLENTNVIIYGHNMKNQTMFGSLKKYATESFYKEHKNITFNTLYEERTYEVFAAFYAKVLNKTDTSFKYYKQFSFPTQDDFDYFVNNVSKMQLYDTGVEPTYGDQFITLSTCSYHTENGRFVVVARRVK